MHSIIFLAAMTESAGCIIENRLQKNIQKNCCTILGGLSYGLPREMTVLEKVYYHLD